MSDNGIIVFTLIVMVLLIVVGGHLGLQTSGGIEKPDLDSDQPGLNVFSWLWTGISFFFAMIAFQVPGLPVWLSSFFLIITLLLIWIILKWVRGSSTGV